MQNKSNNATNDGIQPQAATGFATISPLPATESPPARRTRELSQKLPAGIVIGEWPGRRRKPYFVRFGEKRAMESFATELERNARATELWGDLESEGRSAFAFDPKEWRELCLLKQRTGATLETLEQAWNGFRAQHIAGKNVSEVIEIYSSRRDTSGLSADGLRQTNLALSRFEAAYGRRAANSISDDTISEWLATLPKKYDLGPQAVLRHFSTVRALFNFPAIKKLVKENPCDYVEAPHVPESDVVAVLSLKQAFDFFKANRDQVCVGRLAAEAFAGLRFSSAARLELQDLDFAERGITLPASKHKSGRRHYVDGFPNNLWRWLKFAPAECWGLSQTNYMRLKSEAFIRAGFENPGNVLRHTMPTMHLSAFKNAPATSALLQHRNSTMLYQRYKGRGVSQAVGRAYFMITPKTVLLSFERFCRLVGVTP